MTDLWPAVCCDTIVPSDGHATVDATVDDLSPSCSDVIPLFLVESRIKGFVRPSHFDDNGTRTELEVGMVSQVINGFFCDFKLSWPAKSCFLSIWILTS